MYDIYMSDQFSKTNLLITATYQLLIGTILSCFVYTAFSTVYSGAFIVNVSQPAIVLFAHLGLLIFLRNNPEKKIHKTLFLYGVITLITSVPSTLYFTIGAWLNMWNFVDIYPPMSGMTILTTTLMLMLIPEKLTKLAVASWSLNALPVVLFLLATPSQLQTPRGYDLLFLLGPSTLLILLMIPYQRKIKSHIERITFDLKHSKAASFRDFLTDVFNRRGLDNWLMEGKPSNNICLLLIDIDKFKDINDKFGHSIGDNVLIELTSRLNKVYSELHCLARWGGEEFILVIVNPTPHTTSIIAEMFRTAISQKPYKKIGKVTASIGVSTIKKAKHFDILVDEADKALYFAKTNGRDQVSLYQESLDTQSMDKPPTKD